MLLHTDKSHMFMDYHLMKPHPNLSVSLSNLDFIPSNKTVWKLIKAHHLSKNTTHKLDCCNIKPLTCNLLVTESMLSLSCRYWELTLLI